jgi:hypothetical protein
VKYSREFESVNKILSNWDPIGVPDNIKLSEYLSYVPSILAVKSDYEKIISVLRQLLENSVGYDWENPKHRSDIQKTATEIFNKLNPSLKNNNAL